MKYTSQHLQTFLNAKKLLRQKSAQPPKTSPRSSKNLDVFPNSPENTCKTKNDITDTRNSMLKSQELPGNCRKDRWEFLSTQASSPDFLRLESEKSSPKNKNGAGFFQGVNLDCVISLPISGEEVLEKFPSLLTEYEKTEILDFIEVYYLGEIGKKLERHFRDDKGVYLGTSGDHLAYRFEILSTMGQGTFGKVYKCLDRKHNLKVAIKVLHKYSRMKTLATNEIQAHKLIRESDPEDTKCIVQMLQSFEFRGHICMVFELLSNDLYIYMKNNNFKGLSINVVKRIALQILVALKHIHGLGVIHKDLKLENVLFKQENKSGIKIVDFGSCALFPSPYYSYVQSRYYRAPEVLMGCGHDTKIDVWSFGCMVFELCKGRSLFLGVDMNDQLIKIAMVLGPPPETLLAKCHKNRIFFERMGLFRIRVKTGLKDLVGDDDRLYDFISKCLEWDPVKRISAEDALKHPWIVRQSR